MNCPACGGKPSVLETRERIDQVGVIYVRRRKECNNCSKRYSTIEGDAELLGKLLKINRILTKLEGMG